MFFSFLGFHRFWTILDCFECFPIRGSSCCLKSLLKVRSPARTCSIPAVFRPTAKVVEQPMISSVKGAPKTYRLSSCPSVTADTP